MANLAGECLGSERIVRAPGARSPKFEGMSFVGDSLWRLWVPFSARGDCEFVLVIDAHHRRRRHRDLSMTFPISVSSMTIICYDNPKTNDDESIQKRVHLVLSPRLASGQCARPSACPHRYRDFGSGLRCCSSKRARCFSKTANSGFFSERNRRRRDETVAAFA